MNESKNIKTYLIFFTIFIFIFTWFFDAIHLENIDVDIFQRLINPTIEKGGLVYDPQYNYLYLISTFINYSNFDINNSFYIKIIWIIEKLLLILVAHKLFKYLLKSYNINIFILFTFFYLILQRSGEVDQKTLALSFQLLSIYYFFLYSFNFSLCSLKDFENICLFKE